MNIIDYYYKIERRIRRITRARPLHPAVLDFAVDVAAFTPASLEELSDLERLFFENKGRLIHKWRHYLPIYERHFASYRNKPVRMLEIGVSKGGSLDLWRRYFGPEATIFGIDVNAECLSAVDPPNQVRIGSQADPEFLRSTVDEMGIPDIVLDDGSHIAKHQQVSFEILFPLLREGGIYVIEDLHTSYWPLPYGGGHRRSGTAIEQVKTMIDDMHAWYHNRRATTPGKNHIGAIHIYDSIVVIEKQRRDKPTHIVVGD
jgi:hypothetical protein